MDTASSSRAETDADALIRAHAVSTLAAGIVASLLGTLAYLQLLSPGILGRAAWLGAGRLRFAFQLVMLFGWLGNTLALCFYLGFPRITAIVVRLRVGALKVGVWNFVITTPVVLMALLGILPPAGALTAWFKLSSMSQQTIALLGFLVPASLLMSVRFRLGLRARPFDRAFAMITFGALGLMVGQIGGELVQSMALHRGVPWLDGLEPMHGFWIISVFSCLVIFWGCVLGCVGLSMPADGPRVPNSLRGMRWAHGFMIFAIVMWPVIVYFTETLDASSRPATASEVHGRSVFIREGCASCHGNEDHRGIGPDLSRESGARPADWHFAHLYQPRAVAPLSVMPSYAHLFTGAADQPTQDARDLVSYLESLGRAKDLGAPEAAASAVHPALNPVRARRVGAVPSISGTGNRAEGLRLFANYCVGCHGLKGEGDGPGAAGLRPKPANLAAHRYTDEQVVAALWNGVAGTAMPAWRDQPLDRIAHLVTAVQSMNTGADTGATDAAQLETGARVYAANCTQCHGERGAGDGFSAASLAVAPANFQRQRPSLDYALRVIAGGVAGTPMAPWTSRIKEDELLAVAQYVRSLYTGGAK
jgi:mono/diheme cytochrome c family protein